MIYAFRKFIKSIIYIAIILSGLDANAQVSVVQNIINKIESYKNLSYRSVDKKKELFTSDTIVEQHNAVFQKVPEDKDWGYLFNIESLNERNKLAYTDLYNGQNLIHITPADSTYEIQKIREFDSQATLPGCLKWIQSRLGSRTSKIIKTNDTTIHSVDSYHFVINVYDTIINKEHNYTDVHLYVDKVSGMPDCIIIKSINTTFGNGVSRYYSESSYLDYRFNQAYISIASMTLPQGFHPPRERPALSVPALLTPGSVAPDWSLHTADGRKMSLTKMKGKVILLDFYFIGCENCMFSLNALNNLNEKYRNQNVVIASITDRDNNQTILAFEKNYHIKYPGYVNAANVVKSYHVNAFPTFYLISKEGKIANVIVGYDDDFEEKATSIIDSLLKK